jgi:hypothetical protein
MDRLRLGIVLTTGILGLEVRLQLGYLLIRI